MKVLPFKVTETGFSFRKSAKKVVPFLVVGLMLAAGDSVYAYSGGNGSIARGDDYPAEDDYYGTELEEISEEELRAAAEMDDFDPEPSGSLPVDTPGNADAHTETAHTDAEEDQ